MLRSLTFNLQMQLTVGHHNIDHESHHVITVSRECTKFVFNCSLSFSLISLICCDVKRCECEHTPSIRPLSCCRLLLCQISQACAMESPNFLWLSRIPAELFFGANLAQRSTKQITLKVHINHGIP